MGGKKYFAWLGQIHFDRGTELLYYNQHGKKWPRWAKAAYFEAIT